MGQDECLAIFAGFANELLAKPAFKQLYILSFRRPAKWPVTASSERCWQDQFFLKLLPVVPQLTYLQLNDLPSHDLRAEGDDVCLSKEVATELKNAKADWEFFEVKYWDADEKKVKEYFI